MKRTTSIPMPADTALVSADAARPADDGDRNFVTALARGVELLRAFGPDDDFLGNAELSRRTGIPRPTVSRLTYTLASLGYLVYVEAQEKYRIGQAAMLPAQRYLSGAGIRDIAQPLMQSLAFATGCTVALAAPDRHDMVYLEVCQPRGALVMRLTPGSRLPMATSAIGKAWLAGLTGGPDIRSARRGVRRARASPRAALGIHPHQARAWTARTRATRLLHGARRVGPFGEWRRRAGESGGWLGGAVDQHRRGVHAAIARNSRRQSWPPHSRAGGRARGKTLAASLTQFIADIEPWRHAWKFATRP